MSPNGRHRLLLCATDIFDDGVIFSGGISKWSAEKLNYWTPSCLPLDDHFLLILKLLPLSPELLIIKRCLTTLVESLLRPNTGGKCHGGIHQPQIAVAREKCGIHWRINLARKHVDASHIPASHYSAWFELVLIDLTNFPSIEICIIWLDLSGIHNLGD